MAMPFSLFGWKRRAPREEQDSLEAVLGHSVEVITWTASANGFVFVVSDGLALRNISAKSWTVLPWERVLNIRINADSGHLHWSMLDGSEGSVEIDDPDVIMPSVQECVRTSILVSARRETPDGGEVLITARKAPFSDKPVSWHVHIIRDTDLNLPQIKEFVVARTRELGVEYGVPIDQIIE